MALKHSTLVFIISITEICIISCNDEEEISNDTDRDTEPEGDAGADAGEVPEPLTCEFRESALPTPSGPFCIGAKDYHFINSEQDEPFTPDDDSDMREVEVRIFYPASPEADDAYGVYMEPELIEAATAYVEIPGFAEALEEIETQFRPNAPLADSDTPFPVVLFSPGWGMSFQENLAVIEDMASRGYVVVAMNHPYFSGVTRLSDDSVVYTVIPEDEADSLQFINDMFPLLLADAALVLDEVSDLAEADPDDVFTNRLDMETVGIFGHSLGGALAGTLPLVDDRVDAAIDMDGTVGFYSDDTSSIETPVMIHLAGSHTLHSDLALGDFWDRLTGPGYTVTVADAGHISYTDWPLFIAAIYFGQSTGEENQGTIDPVEMMTIVREYNAAFFDTYLKGIDEALSEDLEEAFDAAVLRDRDDPPEPTATVTSLYLEMRDGVRIAADVWLPAEASEDHPVPTVVRSTRYWRDVEVKQRLLYPITESETEAGYWTDAGFALVLVDVRGSGASFGAWSMPWSPEEQADLGEVVEWIVDQAWSNGMVGAKGLSYEGNTADFVGLSGKAAVKVAAPLFNDFNVYTDIVYPGGIFNEGFIGAWNQFDAALDVNDICAAQQVTDEAACDELMAVLGGVRPVDGDDDRTLLAAAIEDHAENMNVYEAAASAPNLDTPIGDAGFMDISPAQFIDRLYEDAPAYLVQASWTDAYTANGALTRYALSENNTIVYIGAWSHGGWYDTDPYHPADTPVEPSIVEQQGLLIDYFAQYLNGDTPDPIRVITYYTLGEGEWRETDVWPPADVTQSAFYLRGAGALTLEGPDEDETPDEYPVDFTASTGPMNRWWTQLAGDDVVYPDGSEADEKRLTFTSAPLEADLRITGHPEAHIYLSSTHEDGALYLYLEDVAPDGAVTYITEGQLRLIHRKVSESPANWHVFGPYHSYNQTDASPMVPGTPEEIAIGMQPTAVLVEAGHAIRIAIAGHDEGSFARIPEEGNPTLTVYHDDDRRSHIILPVN